MHCCILQSVVSKKKKNLRDGTLLEGVGGGDREACAVVVEGQGRYSSVVRARLPQTLLVLAVPDVHHLQKGVGGGVGAQRVLAEVA